MTAQPVGCAGRAIDALPGRRRLRPRGGAHGILLCSACWCCRFRSSPSWRWSRRSTSASACARWRRGFAALEPRVAAGAAADAALPRAAPRPQARRRQPRRPPRPSRPPTAEPPRVAQPAPPPASRKPPPAAPPAARGARTRHQLRGTVRHPLDGLDRRPRARARRHLPRALFDRGRPDRPGPAAVLRRAARRRAGRRRRMGAPRKQIAGFAALPTRAHPEHPRPPPAPPSPMPRSMRPTRSTTSSPRRSPSCCSASWRWRRSPPRCCTARRSPALGLVGAYVTPLLVASTAAELLGALHLSRGRHGGRLCARAHAAVALAGAHRASRSASLWLLPGIADSGVEALARACCSTSSVGLRAGRGADRRGPVLWAAGRAGQDRSALVDRACGLSVRRAACWCWRAGTIRRR